MSDAGVHEEGGRRGITRRDVLIKGAIVSGAVWVAPVVESFTSPAAAQSTAFTCQFIFVFYFHANKTVYLLYLANGGATCSSTGGANTCTGPTSQTFTYQGNTNSFTLAEGGSGSGGAGSTFPAATANTTYPYAFPTKGGSDSVVGSSGSGACSGQYKATSSAITIGGSSNIIIAAFGASQSGYCSWAQPTSFGTGNCIEISSICAPPTA